MLSATRSLLVRASKILLTFFLFALSFSSVKAQTPESHGLNISPLVFELNSDPGDTVTSQIKLYNPTDTTLSVKIKIEDFAPVGEQGEVQLEEPGENSTYSIASWTSISASDFIISAKQQKIITFTIKVPSNAEPGGHYGSIGAVVSGGTSQVTGSAISSEVASLILLRVSGNIKEEVIIENFKTQNSFYEYGPIDFEVKFKNIGNVHLKPAGFITITDLFGKQVAQIDIPQNNVIPEAVRTSNTKWDTKNLFGIYTATLVANYGSESKQTVTSVTNFTVVPWKKVFIIAVVGVLVLLVLRKFRKRISKALNVLVGKQ